jgi:hypothetical protein
MVRSHAYAATAAARRASRLLPLRYASSAVDPRRLRAQERQRRASRLLCSAAPAASWRAVRAGTRRATAGLRADGRSRRLVVNQPRPLSLGWAARARVESGEWHPSSASRRCVALCDTLDRLVQERAPARRSVAARRAVSVEGPARLVFNTARNPEVAAADAGSDLRGHLQRDGGGPGRAGPGPSRARLQALRRAGIREDPDPSLAGGASRNAHEAPCPTRRAARAPCPICAGGVTGSSP